MTTAAKSLVLAICALATMLLLLLAMPDERPAGPAPAQTGPAQTETTAAVGTTPDIDVDAGNAGKYFFDLIDHSADEFLALLQRAHMIYEQTPPTQRAGLEIVLVLHGPDIEFFAADNYTEYQDIVDTAAQLDAVGVFDFKICSVSAARLGVTPEDVPPFVEFVPFGPTEIERLEASGFARL